MTRPSAASRRVALIAWGNCVEHAFLHQLGLTLQDFRQSFTGSWHFGYVLALREAGIETTSFLFSCCRSEAEQFVHQPTGSRFWLFPAPLPYRLWRRRRRNARDPLLTEYLSTPLLKLGRAIRAEGCTALLVQGHDYPRFDLAILLGRVLGLPVYSTYQGGADLRTGRVLDLVRRWSFRRAAGLIVPSELELARIQIRRGVEPSRVARILNPIDVRFWKPADKPTARKRFSLPDRQIVFAWHGRIDVQQKGLDILIQAWKRLMERTTTPVTLHLLGDGPDRVALEQMLAGTAGIRWIDRFAQDRREVRDFLTAADIYVFPSRAEGFAVAPVEALACALPVIGFRSTPGMPELFAGDVDGGHLVEGFDAEALAQCMLTLAADENRRTASSAQALTRAGELSLPLVGRQLAAMLDSHRTGGDAAIYPTGRRVPGSPLRIVDLHPKGCRRGESFNAQPEGSALAVQAQNATRETSIVFDGHTLPTAFGHPELLTAVLPAALLSRPRTCSVRLTDGVRWSEGVPFQILPSRRRRIEELKSFVDQ